MRRLPEVFLPRHIRSAELAFSDRTEHVIWAQADQPVRKAQACEVEERNEE